MFRSVQATYVNVVYKTALALTHPALGVSEWNLMVVDALSALWETRTFVLK